MLPLMMQWQIQAANLLYSQDGYWFHFLLPHFKFLHYHLQKQNLLENFLRLLVLVAQISKTDSLDVQ